MAGIAYTYAMKISDEHSINRVKRTMAKAEGVHFNKRRAARLYIDCRKWLGTWGPAFG